MSAENYPKITVQVLGYKHRAYLEKCFKSILTQDYPNFELVFIDNNSSDGSEEFARQFDSRIQVIQTGANTGYSGGHNIGIKQTESDFISFVNPDLEMEPNFFSEMIKPMLRDEKIAGVQAKLVRPEPVNGKKILDGTGLVINHSRAISDKGQLEEDNGQYDIPGEVFALNGSCPLYRRLALKDAEIEGEVLDEDLFAYYDDSDLGWRLRNFGWKLWYQPTAIAYHERAIGKTKGGLLALIKHRQNMSFFGKKLSFKNWIFLILKNDFGWPFVRDLPFILKRFLFIFIFTLIFDARVLSILPTFFKQLPRIWYKRKIVKSRRKLSSKEFDKWLK